MTVHRKLDQLGDKALFCETVEFVLPQSSWRPRSWQRPERDRSSPCPWRSSVEEWEGGAVR